MVSFIPGITKTTGLNGVVGVVSIAFYYSFGIFFFLFSGFITMKNIYQHRFKFKKVVFNKS